jgi:hypothetical protein
MAILIFVVVLVYLFMGCCMAWLQWIIEPCGITNPLRRFLRTMFLWIYILYKGETS